MLLPVKSIKLVSVVFSITSRGISGGGIKFLSASVPGVACIQTRYFRQQVPHGQLDLNTNQ